MTRHSSSRARVTSGARITLITLITLAAVGLAPRVAEACAACSNPNLPSGGLDRGGAIRRGRLVVGLEVMGTGARVSHDVAHDDGEPALSDAQQPREHVVGLWMGEATLRALFGVADGWAVELALPFGLIGTDAEFYGEGHALLPDFTSIHHRDELLGGVADIELAGRWSRVADGWSLGARGGLTLPFGDVEPDPYAAARAGRVHTHNFLGAGTLVPVASVDASYRVGESVDLLGYVSAKVPLYEGAEGYRASRTLGGGLMVASDLGVARWRFELGPELRAESAAEWSGRAAENSGRIDLFVSAGALWRVDRAWQLQLSAKVPVVLSAEGSQVSQPLILGVGVRYSVDLGD